MEDPESARPEETPRREMNTPQGKTSLLRHPVWGRVMFYGGLLFLFGILTVIGELRDRQRRERIRLVQVTLNLELIGEALIQYQAEHGTFPPAYIADEEGRPMHSWRVLILPYLDEEWHYEQYNFQKPWDDPENLKLLEAIPFCYRSPWDSARDEPPLTTPFVAFSATGTVLGTTEGVSLQDISQPPGEIPIVIGNFQHQIPWTEPTDISPRQWVALHGWMVDNKKYPSMTVQADGTVQTVDLRDPPEDLAGRSVIERPAAAVP